MTAPKTDKTLASIVFHGPADSNALRNAVSRVARAHGGRLRYTSFKRRDGGWHSEPMVGKAAYSLLIPISQYRAAHRARHTLIAEGLIYSHRWSHYGSLTKKG